MALFSGNVGGGRRSFIKQVGCLVISLPVMGVDLRPRLIDQEMPGSLKRHPSLDAWLEVIEDNRIRVFTGKIELGQGITTVIRQVAAEELNAHIDQVEVVMADTDRTPNEGYTAGSGSVKGSAMSVRLAAAYAKERLCQMGAEKLQIDQDRLVLKEGVVFDPQSSEKASIGELLDGKRWEVDVELPVTLKESEEYQYVGKDIPRPELKKVMSGESFFIQDLSFPDMLHARIQRPSFVGSEMIDGDLEGFKKAISKDLEVWESGNTIAVLGEDEYQVVKAIGHLPKYVKWAKTGQIQNNEHFKALLPKWSYEEEQVVEGDIEKVRKLSVADFGGSFYKPYIMHGSIAPACSVALYERGKLQVWTNSQGVFPLRSALAAMLKIPREDIHVIGVPGAGCFGHNSADDAAGDAAVLAQSFPGRHIRVQWSRSQEHTSEALGCAMRMDVQAGLAADGSVSFWKSDVYTDSHSTRPNDDPGTLLTARYLSDSTPLNGRGYLRGGHRNAEPYYNVAVKSINAHFYEGPHRVSSLRSLGAYANIFAIESIIDEMSQHLDEHPIDFRVRLLKDDRAVSVLKRLKENTSHIKPKQDEGLGYAFSRYKNSDAYCAVAAYVKVDRAGKVVIKGMWAVLDAGEVMNADGLMNQTEGGMIQAASWTLAEEVKTDASGIISENWVTYPIFRYQDVPELAVTLMSPPGVPPLGGGEAATPPTPGAITNAIFQATGIRIYDLPVKPDKLVR